MAEINWKRTRLPGGGSYVFNAPGLRVAKIMRRGWRGMCSCGYRTTHVTSNLCKSYLTWHVEDGKCPHHSTTGAVKEA